MALLKSVTDDFGKVRIFNFLELVPFIGTMAWFIFCAITRTPSFIDLGVLVIGCFVSFYFMFLRLTSFVVGLVMMVSAFMPILQKLRENGR